MILEDDAKLVRGFKEKFQKALSELPEDWDALWLNGTETKKGFKVGTLLKKVKEIWGTFGYVVNSSFYDVCIGGLEKEIESADGFLTSIQSKHQVYSLIEPLVKHRKGFSEIAGVVVERYKHLE